MKHIPILCAILAHAIFSLVIANAQTGTTATEHYEKDGLAFDYPEGWHVTNSASPGVQTVTLERKGTQAKIVVTMQDGLTSTCDFQAERKKISEALTEKLAAELHSASNTILPVTTHISGFEVGGSKLQGVVNRKPVSGFVFSLRISRRFISLVYILAVKDERAKSAWDTIRTTLTVEPGVLTLLGTKVADSSDTTQTPGMVSGHLVDLPKPDYPKIAKSARAAGTVKVQVTIDETGKVISAHAIEGHPLLRATSVAAAKQATFSQTKLCGEPVRVTGVITYNFVAQ